MRIPRQDGPSTGAQAKMWTERLRVWLTLSVLLAFLLSSPLQTWAHNDPPSTLPSAEASQHESQVLQPQLPSAQPLSPTLPGTPLTFMLFVLVAVVMALAVRRWRRTTALGLVLVLGTFTLGIAVHSVHHLSEPEKASECPVFLAFQHVSATLAEPCDVYTPALAVTTASPDTREVPAVILSFRSDLPRAPPSFLS
jgi:hypothetical protein